MKSLFILLFSILVLEVVCFSTLVFSQPSSGPFPVPTPSQLVRTNFISGQLYTNTYGKPIQVSCVASNVDAAVAGNSILALWCFAQGAADIVGFTNQFGATHQATIVAITNFGILGGNIPANYVWVFTNQSTTSGDDAKPTMGQIWVP